MTDDDKIVRLAEVQQQKQAANIVTEDAAALLFTERHRNALLFDHDIGKWFVWTGSRWQCERTALAFSWARNLARELAAKEPDKVRYTTSKTSFAAGVERFARADRTFAVTSEIWDRDTFLLGTPDGVVDLHTAISGRPIQPTTSQNRRPSDPTDVADCPLWIRFLHEATDNDEGLIAFLQQFCRLHADRRHPGARPVVHLRPGRQRQDRVPQYRRRRSLPTTAKSPPWRRSPLADSTSTRPTSPCCSGARLVCATETEEGRAWAESRIKQLTGGDKISAQVHAAGLLHLHAAVQAGLHRQPQAGPAQRRRRRPPPLQHRAVPPQAANPRPAPRAEAARGMAGHPALDDRGLPRLATRRPGPAAGRARRNRRILLRAGHHPPMDRGHAATPAAATSPTPAANLFRSWNAYAVASGEKPSTQKWFAQVLTRLGYEKTRHLPGSHNKRGFLRIATKPEPTKPHWQDGLP